MEKIGFARLLSHLTKLTGHEFDRYEIGQVLNLITESTPVAQAPDANTVRDLLNFLASNRKIEAIKAHRTLTGDGLKESKDAVERIMDQIPRTTAA